MGNHVDIWQYLPNSWIIINTISYRICLQYLNSSVWGVFFTTKDVCLPLLREVSVWYRIKVRSLIHYVFAESCCVLAAYLHLNHTDTSVWVYSLIQCYIEMRCAMDLTCLIISTECYIFVLIDIWHNCMHDAHTQYWDLACCNVSLLSRSLTVWRVSFKWPESARWINSRFCATRDEVCY